MSSTDPDESGAVEDDTVVHRLARGDEVALAELYDRLAPAVYHLIGLLIPDRPDTATVTRATFIDLWTRAPDPHLLGGASVDIWVLATAHRLAAEAQGRQWPPRTRAS